MIVWIGVGVVAYLVLSVVLVQLFDHRKRRMVERSRFSQLV